MLIDITLNKAILEAGEGEVALFIKLHKHRIMQTPAGMRFIPIMIPNEGQPIQGRLIIGVK